MWLSMSANFFFFRFSFVHHYLRFLHINFCSRVLLSHSMALNRLTFPNKPKRRRLRRVLRKLEKIRVECVSVSHSKYNYIGSYISLLSLHHVISLRGKKHPKTRRCGMTPNKHEKGRWNIEWKKRQAAGERASKPIWEIPLSGKKKKI